MSEIKENIVEETIEAANEQVAQAVNTMTGMFEGVDTAVPEAVRELAEQTVTQSREAYENAKGAMEEAVEVLEKSIDQTGQGVAAINRKAIGIAQTNLNTSFDLAKKLAGAKNVAEIMELQSSFVRNQFETFAAQAEEFRTLSTQITTDAISPVTEHVTKSFDKIVTR